MRRTRKMRFYYNGTKQISLVSLCKVHQRCRSSIARHHRRHQHHRQYLERNHRLDHFLVRWPKAFRICPKHSRGEPLYVEETNGIPLSLLFSRVLRDSTPRFVGPSVRPSVRRSVGPSVRQTLLFFVFAVFGLTAPAQMVW